jgi:thioredoxin 1
VCPVTALIASDENCITWLRTADLRSCGTRVLSEDFEAVEPARTAVDQLEGPVVIEFGAPWCGHCLAARPLLERAFADHPAVRHIRIEDGRGRRLGRSFRVRLWPTLIFLCDGREQVRLVRPDAVNAIRDALALIDRPGCP